MTVATTVSVVDTQARKLALTNPDFLFSKIAGEVPAEQQYRELVRNGIEAGSGERVAVKLAAVTRGGVRKLAVIDTGVGMTPEQMVHNFSGVGTSGKEQGREGNFGVGVKFTSAHRNPEGVEIISLAAGAGKAYTMRLIAVDGMPSVDRHDGHDFRVANPDLVPDEIVNAGHGTVVILHGRTAGEDTVVTAGGGKTKGLTAYLNSRFFTIPDGAKVGCYAEISGKNRTNGRIVRGQKHYLDMAASSNGTVNVAGADIHWWIADADKKANSGVKDEAALSGVVGALYQGEIYRRLNGHEAARMLRHFGVSAGTADVSIVVEPHDATANLVRTDLNLGELSGDPEAFTFERFATLFRDNLPDEIVAHIEAASAASEADSVAKLAKRIAQLGDLLTLQWARGAGRGRGAAERSGGETKKREAAKRNTPRVPPLGFGDLRVPEVSWISSAHPDWCAELNQGAFYDEANNVLLLNEDFAPLRRLVEVVIAGNDKISTKPRERKVAEAYALHIAKEWTQLSVVEAVLSAQTLAASPGWQACDAEQLTSSATLSLVMMQRYHTMGELNRALGRRYS